MYQNTKRAGLSYLVAYFVIWASLVVTYIGLQLYFTALGREENVVTRLQSGVHKELRELKSEAKILSDVLTKETDNNWTTIDEQLTGSKHFSLIYQNDSLIYWNNNQLSGDLHNIKLTSVRLLETQTGWYLIHYQKEGSFDIYLASQLKSRHHKSLEITSPSILSEWYNFENVQFTRDSTITEYPIYSERGDFLLGIDFLEGNRMGINMIKTLFIIYILGYVFFLLWIAAVYKKMLGNFKHQFLLFLFLTLDIILIRAIELITGFPTLLKSSYIFENQFDIIVSLNSPGSILISSMLFLFLSVELYNLLKNQANLAFKKRATNSIVFLSIWLIAFLLFSFVLKVITQLPYQSLYGFDMQWDGMLYVAIELIIGIFSCLIIIHAFFSHFVIHRHDPIFTFLSSGVIGGFISWFFLHTETEIIFIVAILLLSLYSIYFYLALYQKQSFYKFLIVIILFAAATAFTLNTARKTSKDIHQVSTLQALSDSKDEELENTFLNFSRSVEKDSVVIAALTNESTDFNLSIKDYIIQNYFGELASKYNIQITVCSGDNMLEIQPEGIIVNCTAYFENLISEVEKIQISDDLYLIPGEPESIYYVGKKVISPIYNQINIYFEFFFTYVPAGLGYPELLVSEAAMDIDLTGYSFARYQNDQLIYKFGDFPYHTSMDYMELYNDLELFNKQDYRHIKQKVTENAFLIISRPTEKWAVQLVSFSGLFIIFITIIFIVSLFVFSKQATNFLHMSFQNRLQIIFVSAISFIIILIAIITLFYINIDNQNRLTDQLNEKTNSVIVELQHKLSGEPDLHQIDQDELEMLLQKFSLVFFSDINLYSPSGQLISTSRPEIFNRGLLSENINPRAFEELFIKNQLFYTTLEKLGSVTYYSSYAPLMLTGDKPAGIINLPYFAKQSDVTRSYYQIVFTFINLFVILGIFGTVIVLILSRLITKPLIVLQKNLAAIQIDKQNEVIEWKGDDEIGQLIKAYNQMIVKLEQSTELLKRSEREMAWREVAQQIAHEIKNPLTPMKLNIQYLEKAFRERDPELEQKVSSISQMLITQIETLNRVAEMFSDFAKTKSRKFEQVNLQEMISKSIQLYENHADLTFDFDIERGNGFFIKAFEKDMLRVFNNLIKNSIQSMDGLEKGIIKIQLFSVEDAHFVEFIDNGKGISDSVKANIFKPYFTTKSTGTGLGLAIVKSIMNEIGGEITFESAEGTGTRFILKFSAFKA